MLDDAKRYKDMSDLEKKAYDKLEEMKMFKNKKDSVGLAKNLKEILDLIELVVKEQNKPGQSMDYTAELSTTLNDLRRQHEDVITDLCKNDQEFLLNLSYELIKIESDAP